MTKRKEPLMAVSKRHGEPIPVQLTWAEVTRLPMIAAEMSGHAERAIHPDDAAAYRCDAALIQRIHDSASGPQPAS